MIIFGGEFPFRLPRVEICKKKKKKKLRSATLWDCVQGKQELVPN